MFELANPKCLDCACSTIQSRSNKRSKPSTDFHNIYISCPKPFHTKISEFNPTAQITCLHDRTQTSQVLSESQLPPAVPSGINVKCHVDLRCTFRCWWQTVDNEVSQEMIVLENGSAHSFQRTLRSQIKVACAALASVLPLFQLTQGSKL